MKLSLRKFLASIPFLGSMAWFNPLVPVPIRYACDLLPGMVVDTKEGKWLITHQITEKQSAIFWKGEWWDNYRLNKAIGKPIGWKPVYPSDGNGEWLLCFDHTELKDRVFARI